MSRFFKSAAFPILIVVVLAFFAQQLISPGNDDREADVRATSTPSCERSDVRNVEMQQQGQRRSRSRSSDKSKYKVGFASDYADTLTNRLIAAESSGKIQDFDVKGTKTSGWLSLLTYVLPFLIFIGFWIFLMNQMQGGGSKVMSFGKSRAKRMSVDSPKITFRDVAGADEAVEELHEIKEFLENPKKFQALGARIPKGVLLFGPPGTGKTLLARAVAGEAGRAVLLDLRLGLRRDVRRRRRQPRARPLRAGQAEQPLHHLHGRDRRRRPPPRRRHGRRSRRARADAQPAPRRDGRLHDDGQHHPHRGHQPAGHPRPRAAAPGPLRPPDRRRPPRPQGPRARSSTSTPAASRWPRRSTSTTSPARRRASPAPTWPTSSTRPPCSPRATASARSASTSSRKGSCA